MKRNKIFLAVSILLASVAFTEAQAHNSSSHGDEATSGENFQSMVRTNRSRGNRGFRRGGWRSFFRQTQDGWSSRYRVFPTAEADIATTTVDTATTINPLANDTGTGLTLKNLFENTQEGGTASNIDGVVTYTPPAGFSGTDEFWYVVSDADGRTNAASVTIEVSGVGTTDVTDTVLTDVTTDATTEVTDAVFTDATTDVTDTVITGTTTSASTVGVRCDYAEDAFNDSPSVAVNSTSTWNCDESLRNLTANGIPDHAVGTFPSDTNTNAIAEQVVSESFTLTPTKTETMSTPDVIGYALNGVKFDAVTTGSCNVAGDECDLTDDSGMWSIEALGQTSFDFGSDENNAYVQDDGAYTYHGMPEGFLTNQGASDAVMTLVGWAADGFPIYGRHGHTIADDVDSDLKVMTGSYQLAINGDGTRPSLETYVPGTFTQDWMYFAGSGDLDECNGRTGVTPEFPDGIYHYFATDNYPYLPRCVKGDVEGATVTDTVVVEMEDLVEDTDVTDLEDQVVDTTEDLVEVDDLTEIIAPEFAQ